MNRNAHGFPPPPPYGPPAPPPYDPAGRGYGGAPGHQPPGRHGHPVPPAAPPAAPPAGPRGRTIATVVVLGLVVVTLVGAGVYFLLGGTMPFGSAATKPATVSTDAPATDAPDVAFSAGGSDTVPDCPFTAERIGALVGEKMTDPAGTCLFGDGKGVAQISIVPASTSTTSITMDYMRDSATRIYTKVEDLPGGGPTGWIATKDTEAMAMAVTGKGGYTITMSGFPKLGGDRYAPVLRDVIAALPQ